MIDIELIRENPQKVKAELDKRLNDVSVDELAEWDEKWRASKQKEEELRAERNRLTEQVKEAKQKGKGAEQIIKKAKGIPAQIEGAKKKTQECLEKRNALWERTPNIPHESVPGGPEENYKIVKEHGKKPVFAFKPKRHDELCNALGILDMARAAKLAGTGFYIFKDDLARLNRALISFFLDFHKKNGLDELSVPYMVNRETAFGTGNLPKFEDDLYKTKEGKYLISTAEIPLTNYFAGETIDERELPKRLCSFTPCFRVEAGQHGINTPGFFRLHQFDKVEMVYISKQEDSWEMLEEMRSHGEKLIEKIGLHYRTKLLAAGDMGIASAKTYDLEVYAPGMDKYLETSSVSNCTDFQARRMNTKYDSKGERKLVHTLNGSGLATPRLLISIIESFQGKDESIKIPKPLQEYMGGQKEIAPAPKKGK